MNRTPIRSATVLLLASTLLAAGCGDYLPQIWEGEAESPFSSREATLLDFEFEGEFVTASTWGLERLAQDQLLYTIGHLNGNNSVGRLDKLVLTNFRSSGLPDGTTRVQYHATLPVAWGSKTNLPTSYQFLLPKRVDYAGQEAFTAKYKDRCVDWGAHDVDTGSMWYYYRPRRSGCVIDPADAVGAASTVRVSTENTTGKYPEYHRVWSDGSLDVVAIFGKYEDGATTSSDAGIAAYNRFVSTVRQSLGSSVTTTPSNVPSNPGIAVPDVTFRATLAGGRTATVTALLVDNVRTAGPAFNARYNDLSETADMIFYNGHAGLGQNVRALANKGSFLPGKYQIFFMNGCDTFAYVDGALAQKKASINPDDPNGTKYLDMVTNAMPSFFSSMPYASMALIEGLLDVDAPKTWETIFAEIDDAEVVVVTGEEDNEYRPGQDPGEPDGWSGLSVAGSVARDEEARWSTPELPAGSYRFELAHDPAAPGAGDADLYVNVGAAATTQAWVCRPYENGSDERCDVTLSAKASIHVMIRGYASGSSGFLLTGAAQ